MRWLTWDEGAVAAVVSGLVVVWFRAPHRFRPGPVAERPRFVRWVEPAAVELCLIATLYAIWRLARQLPFTREAGALERGRQIYDVQNWLHIPSELRLQRFVDAHNWLGPPMSYYYALVHVPALVAFMIWMFARHRDQFPHWRNGLVYVTAACLVIRFVRVAPPRFFPELGFEDLAAKYGPSVYGPVADGVSDQFAAMPSIHVAWAAVVSFGAFAVLTGVRRWLALSHVVITALVVSASGHHWWLDGIVAVVLLWLGLWFDGRWRRRRIDLSRSDTDGDDAGRTDPGRTDSGRDDPGRDDADADGEIGADAIGAGGGSRRAFGSVVEQGA